MRQITGWGKGGGGGGGGAEVEGEGEGGVEGGQRDRGEG